MRILVIGRGGQLARALAAASSPHELIFLGREQADLTRPDQAARAVAALSPDLVVNAAAYTAVDRAEQEPALAHAVNAEGVAALARAAAEAGCALAHVSTDYVFDGARAGAWRPDDPTGPLCVYGASKLEGERRALAANPRTLVLRTSWVFSPWGRNFVRTMLGLAARESLRVVDDQIGRPTSALDLAEAILAIAPRLTAPAGAPVWGVQHYAGSGAPVSWAGFAERIFARAAALGMIARAPRIERIGADEYPTPARRPANSTLDCTGFAQVFGAPPAPWEEGLERVLRIIQAEEPEAFSAARGLQT